MLATRREGVPASWTAEMEASWILPLFASAKPQQVRALGNR